MNRKQKLRTCTMLLLFSSWLCHRADADETAKGLEQEEVQCRRNLHLIYEAIQAYRRLYKDLPSELAELTPRFLSDVHLVCPEARRLGLTSSDMVAWSPPGSTTYTYEFTP